MLTKAEFMHLIFSSSYINHNKCVPLSFRNNYNMFKYTFLSLLKTKELMEFTMHNIS